MDDCQREILNFVQSTNKSCCYINRNKYAFSYEVHVTISCLFIVVFIFNVIGNIGVWLIVPFKKSLRSPMNYLLLNLTLSHFISGVFVLVYCYTLDVGCLGTDNYYKLKTLCSLTEGLGPYFTAAGANMLTLCGIGFNRFLAIQYPTRQELRMQKNSVFIFCTCTWVLSLVIMLPNLMSFRYEKQLQLCVREWDTIHPVAYRVMFLILAVVLPLSFIISSFVAILWKRKRKSKNIFAGGNISITRTSHLMRAEKLLGAVILTFVIFWSPFFSYWGLYTAGNTFVGCQGEIDSLKWIRVTVLIASMNSAVDPFIYILGSSVLRREYKRRLRMLYSKLICSSINRIHTEFPLTDPSDNTVLPDVTPPTDLFVVFKNRSTLI